MFSERSTDQGSPTVPQRRPCPPPPLDVNHPQGVTLVCKQTLAVLVNERVRPDRRSGARRRITVGEKASRARCSASTARPEAPTRESTLDPPLPRRDLALAGADGELPHPRLDQAE